KMRIAPALFAVLFGYLLVAFPNHLLLNIRDGMGLLCDGISTSWKDIESKTFYFDIGSNREVDATDQLIRPSESKDATDQLCFATGIRVDRGWKYLFAIQTAAEPEEIAAESADRFSSRIARWTLFGSLSSTGGVSMAGTRQAHPHQELPVTRKEIADFDALQQREDLNKRAMPPTSGEQAVRA